MASQPLRRQRLGKPSQAPLARAGLSTWRALSPAEKLETLFGCSLNRAFEVLSWPADGLDPVRLAAQTNWGRAVLNLASKVGLEAAASNSKRRFRNPVSAYSGEIRARRRGAKIWGEDRSWEAALAIALADRG